MHACMYVYAGMYIFTRQIDVNIQHEQALDNYISLFVHAFSGFGCPGSDPQLRHLNPVTSLTFPPTPSQKPKLLNTLGPTPEPPDLPAFVMDTFQRQISNPAPAGMGRVRA